MLNPIEVSKLEDEISNSTSEGDDPEQEKRPPFMTFLGDSILGAGKMVLLFLLW
ncbi:MAG: hypothetical protein LBP35_02495 [Candidatus Ancillula trichonymphae]|nr:hypothetical protein [Candidatus Ancillula trichonymphae]